MFDVRKTAGMTDTYDQPRRTATETRILEAARALFFSEGYAAATTDRLCKAAGVSKTSLYKYFGDMSGVLAAVVQQEGDFFLGKVDIEATTPTAFWRGLVSYGASLLRLLNEKDCVQFDQMLHEQARSHTDVARIFYDAAYGRGHREVTTMLAHGKTQGFIRKPQSAEDLADNLISMWEGLAFVRTRLGLMVTPFPAPGAWALQCVQTLFEADFVGGGEEGDEGDGAVR